jgi:hypothetical protein
MSLSGTASALSTYLNAAGRLLFNGTASTTAYTLTATVQRDVAGVVQSAASAKASLTAALWVTSSRDGAAVSPLITQLPTSLAITSGTASSLVFTGLALDDGNASEDDTLTLTLSAPISTGTLTASAAGSVSVQGSGTRNLVLSGKASDLQTFLRGSTVGVGPVVYNGTATGLTLELANVGGGKVLTNLALSASTQASVSGSSAAFSLPTTVNTTPGASVAIPFHAQALVAAGPVTLAFAASGGASLAWDSTPVTGLTISSSAANTVSLQGSPDLINSYLSSGKLKTGGSGSVAVSGAASGTVTVTQAANSSVATALPTLNLPNVFQVHSGGTLPFAAGAVGSSESNVRRVVIKASSGGSLSAGALTTGVTATGSTTGVNTLTFSGTEASLSAYLATAGKITFTGVAGYSGYTLTVNVENPDGSGSQTAQSSVLSMMGDASFGNAGGRAKNDSSATSTAAGGGGGGAGSAGGAGTATGNVGGAGGA